MNHTDLKLYELLGDKTLSFGCIVKYVFEQWYVEYFKYIGEFDNIDGKIADHFLSEDGGKTILNIKEIGTHIRIIGHEPTIANLHRWMNEKVWLIKWTQEEVWFSFHFLGEKSRAFLYDSSKSLLSQSEETKLAIISLITSYS